MDLSCTAKLLIPNNTLSWPVPVSALFAGWDLFRNDSLAYRCSFQENDFTGRRAPGAQSLP